MTDLDDAADPGLGESEQDDCLTVTTAATQLALAVDAFVQAISSEAARDELGVVKLPPPLAEVWAARSEIVSAAADLGAAWEVVLDQWAVSDRLPGNGEYWRPREDWPRWVGPLTPRGILMAAREAKSGDADYLTQLMANAAYHQARTASKDGSRGATCGRVGASGNPCCLLASYATGGAGYAGGLPCWRHLTSSERDHLEGEYRKAIATIACPGCDAPAGVGCRWGEEGRVHPVDGYWPKRRHVGAAEAHDVRLDALPLDESPN